MNEIDSDLERSLEERGQALALGLGFVFGEHLTSGDIEVAVVEARIAGTDEQPQGFPSEGALLVHEGTLTSPGQESFRIGWFLGERVREALEQAAEDPEGLRQKLEELAQGLAEHLATDRYRIERSEAVPSIDLWEDYLAGDRPPRMGWLRFRLSGLESGSEDLLVAWPIPLLEWMFGRSPQPIPEVGSEMDAMEAALGGLELEPEMVGAEAGAPSLPVLPSPAPIAPRPVAPAPRRVAVPTGREARIERLLKTEVPLIVTLASKAVRMSKLLELRAGAIIEFDRKCDEPLELSVNNLPIGEGEAVKVGEHFGLKIARVVTTEERIERMGGKPPS